MFINSYDTYIFLLCLIVFSALTAMFSYLLYELTNLTINVIRAGLEDKKIIAYFNKPSRAPWKKKLSLAVSFFLILALVGCLIASLYFYINDIKYPNTTTLRVVASSSMSKRHPSNQYLVDNNLASQLNMFDLIITNPPPQQEEIQLYDIVIYQYENTYIIHRVVSIQEINGEYFFKTQGDAISAPDAELVKYDQIKAIYNGEKIPYVGSFVFFLRSPAGWLCILLILFVIITTPIVERKLYREYVERIVLIEVDKYDQ